MIKVNEEEVLFQVYNESSKISPNCSNNTCRVSGSHLMVMFVMTGKLKVNLLVGTSYISKDQAILNLQKELNISNTTSNIWKVPDFYEIVLSNKNSWNKYLSRVEV